MSAKKVVDLSAIAFDTVATDTRTPVTSTAVVRPTRDIVAGLHERVRKAAWAATLQTVADSYGKPIEAKGSDWIVNHDEAARAIRVNYNLIQPDYFPKKIQRKITQEQSQMIWTQICEQLGKGTPEFLETSDEGDN